MESPGATVAATSTRVCKRSIVTLRGLESDAFRFVLLARRLYPSGRVVLSDLCKAAGYQGGAARLARLFSACPRLWIAGKRGVWFYRSDRSICGESSRARVPYVVTRESVPLRDADSFRVWLTRAVARCTARLVSIYKVAELRGISPASASRHLSGAERKANALDTGIRCASAAEAFKTARGMSATVGGWFYHRGRGVFRRLAFSYAPIGERRNRRVWGGGFQPLTIRRVRGESDVWREGL